MTFAFVFAYIFTRNLQFDNVEYIFRFCNHRQPTLKSRKEQFDCPSSEVYKFRLSRPNHTDQPQEILGLLQTRSSKEVLGSCCV